jgi:ADP-ribose pyrophosphatase
MTKNYKILKEEMITSPHNRKHQLVDVSILTPNKKEVVWQYVKTRDVVTVLAINNQSQIYCVRQWRPARKDFVWELPAGGIEVENPTQEQVFENANRELQEEIGLKANKMEIISSFSPSIHIACTYYVVLAKDLVPSFLPQDADEDLEVKALPLKEANNLLINQQLPSALTLVGLTLAGKYLKK